MHQSASGRGVDSMEHLNGECLKKRRFGPFSLTERIVNRKTPSVIGTLLKISDDHQWSKTATKDLVWIATCLFCDATYLANTDLHSQRDELKWAIYSLRCTFSCR